MIKIENSFFGYHQHNCGNKYISEKNFRQTYFGCIWRMYGATRLVKFGRRFRPVVFGLSVITWLESLFRLRFQNRLLVSRIYCIFSLRTCRACEISFFKKKIGFKPKLTSKTMYICKGRSFHLARLNIFLLLFNSSPKSVCRLGCSSC